ncbi:bifunctional 4-hydroxy-2-oxoglutarate aldolase/2-dehydro-3-deoxy-phosphogluconate aldolase [Phycicoccus endophyticus]|uniref:Bifunctional 4-hydroxy-2-oxoglutarate aldolase/2-dehydro-3-deoxy-phosphogluconate aldolase n=1 Tax=Phycicoccus endophyticus TaxID=1690220 RepID=A0A7G9R5F2_9MICO|nr:bifunctional 4-hydroxy-2-oxoglutarate aldolase/2-dehydro-3-deoxy-phosphogluconate aldolase [Phycicoccus endophyticus]QNN50827.1 bifunctional 4-hydroxy-2-oxoglutarate aldolase/2-dehydro-3-deoxy-phosphogluconate aldolase [Phycicoccus endophyticus]
MVLGELAASPVVAILRGGDARATCAVGRTLLGEGVRWLEVTTNSPGWQDALGELAGDGSRVGAGTVRSPQQVDDAAAAGATFVVSPDTDGAVGRRALELGLAWLPGAMTPTEVVAAHRLGATAVKVFPVGSVGGPEYVRAVRAPLDDIPLVPTGGVALGDIPAYLAAGAVAVGLGSPLVGDSLRGGSLEALGERARTAMAGAVASEEVARG